MRYVDISLRPRGGWSPLGGAISEDPELDRRAVHQLTPTDGGGAVMVYEVDGSADRVREILTETPGIEEFDVSGDESQAFVYATIEPTPLVQALLALPASHGVVVDTPLVFRENGRISLTLVGKPEAVRGVLNAIPDAVDFTVESTGEYRPGASRLFETLTDRQQEILLTALEMGYYDEPRQVTYEDIADATDCSRTTVGEHLRKAERAVVTGVVP